MLPRHPLQSKSWADFRRTWGNEVIKTKYGYITCHKLPVTSYKVGMFIRGPKPTQPMLTDLKKIAKENNLIFIKLEPFTPKEQGLENLLKKNDCVPGKTLFTPTSFWIDLTKSEEELMQSFSSKTRYNIRLAQKRGVKIKLDNSDQAFETYLRLTRETIQRQGFYAHSERYHRLMWNHLHTKPQAISHKPLAFLLTATYQKKIITAWILFAYKGFLYYPYGASSDRYKNVMANNLMMWEAIRFGKKLGLSTFDLWGREEGKGFTRFKEGYNPRVIEFVGTWDLIINKPLYNTYRTIDFLRWILLRTKSRLIKPKF